MVLLVAHSTKLGHGIVPHCCTCVPQDELQAAQSALSATRAELDTARSATAPTAAVGGSKSGPVVAAADMSDTSTSRYVGLARRVVRVWCLFCWGLHVRFCIPV